MPADPTLSALVDEVLLNLQGYTADQVQYTTLTAAISDTDLVLSVTDATQASRGILEIEDELVLANSTDEQQNTITLSPGGRGYFSTTAAAHAVDSLIRVNPRFTRESVKKAINDTIQGVYPLLYQIATLVLKSAAFATSYTVPNAGRILEVSWLVPGPGIYWAPARHWRILPSLDGTETSRQVLVADGMTPGRDVRFTYTSAPTTLDTNTAPFSSTGLKPTARDVIVFGALSRLIANEEGARLQTQAIESDARDPTTPVGSAVAASHYYLARYQQRLQEEAARLQHLTPVPSHFTGR